MGHDQHLLDLQTAPFVAFDIIHLVKWERGNLVVTIVVERTVKMLESSLAVLSQELASSKVTVRIHGGGRSLLDQTPYLNDVGQSLLKLGTLVFGQLAC